MSSKDRRTGLEFERWVPLAKQVVHRSLGLRWKDALEIYSYIPTIPLAEALALEARRVGSDTHITLMTDDLWFTSMNELPRRWLSAPSSVEQAINGTITAYVYLGGPADARRMRDIPQEKFEANAIGNIRQDEPKRRRRVRQVDLSIGRVCPERADAYGLDYKRWKKSYDAALAVDLREIRSVGESWSRKLAGRRSIHVSSNAGTNVTFETKRILPIVDDGIISASDVRRGFLETSLPAGKVVSSVVTSSVEGEVHFMDPIFLMGRTVRGLRLRFRKGRLVGWEADENAELLAGQFGNRPAGDNRLGWFTMGLNPAAEPCMLDNSIVKNDVGIGFGPHPELDKRRAPRRPHFQATIGVATVDIAH